MRFTQNTEELPLFMVGVMLALIGGCAPSQATLHESFGASVTSAQRAQNANPRAGENLSPVAQMNGRAAEQVVDAYAKSFSPEAAPKVDANAMFVGFGAAGGQQ